MTRYSKTMSEALQEVQERASAKRDAMRAMGRNKGIDPADVDTDASDDDKKAASKNILMQLRKSVSMRGNHNVEFASGKHKVDAKIAQAVQDKFMKIKRPADKQAFQDKIGKSYKDLLTALKEEYEMSEAKEAYVCEDCGCEQGNADPNCSCPNDSTDLQASYWVKKESVDEGFELEEGMKMNDPKLLKMFDKLKKGSKIKLKTSSTISQGKDYVEYIVKSKNLVNKGRVEKITLATVGNEKAVKKFLYKRDGTVGFAIGDMGASIDDIKEGTWALPDSPKAKADFKKLMSKPIKLGKEGDDASDKLYALVGDDELFDDLYVAGKKNPNGDARAVVKKHMKRLGIKEAIDPSDTGGQEEVSMAMRQVAGIRHFVDGIEMRVKTAGDMEEWYQNKLTKAHDYLETIYSYGKGDMSEAFKPHMMYDPKTGKGYKAEKEADHLRMKDMGYTHEKPEMDEETLDEMKEPFAVVDTADGNKVVGTASDEKGAKSIITTSQLPPMKIKDKKTLKIVKVKKKQMIGQPIKEEDEPQKPDSAKEVEQGREDKKKTRIAQLQLQIAKAQETINKMNSQEK